MDTLDIKERWVMEQVKKGLSSFVLLMEQYYDRLYRFVARRSTDENQRKRFLEAIFREARGRFSEFSFDNGVRFEVWLYRIAESVVGLSEKISASASPDIVAAFAQFTFKEQEMLRLRFFEQLNDSEIAYVLRLDESAVGSGIYALLKKAKSFSGKERLSYFGGIVEVMVALRVDESISIDRNFLKSLKDKLDVREKKEGKVEREKVHFETPEVQPMPKVSEIHEEDSFAESHFWSRFQGVLTAVFVLAVVSLTLFFWWGSRLKKNVENFEQKYSIAYEDMYSFESRGVLINGIIKYLAKKYQPKEIYVSGSLLERVQVDLKLPSEERLLFAYVRNGAQDFSVRRYRRFFPE